MTIFINDGNFMALESESNFQTEINSLVEAYFDAADASIKPEKALEYHRGSKLCDIRHRELLLRDKIME